MAMEELQDQWKGFTLTEVKDCVVEDDTGNKEIGEQPQIFILGHLLSLRSFNAPALINLMKSVWRPIKTMVVDTIEENCFLFKFHGRADADRVLEGRPWFFNKHILLLEEASVEIQPRKLVLATTPYGYEFMICLSTRIKRVRFGSLPNSLDELYKSVAVN